MNVLAFLLSFLVITPAAPLEQVSADSPFITGNSIFLKNLSGLNYSSITFYDDCNNDPKQYNSFHHKLVLFHCDTNCLQQIWRINGISMTPTLKSRSLLKMAMNGFGNLTEGMIVVYDPRTDVMGSPLDMDNAKKYNYNIIHRIVAVQGENYVIRGDHNSACELIPKLAIKAVLLKKDY